MNKYVVILFADEKEPGTAVAILRSIDNSVYEHYGARGVYFTRFAGTAQQLSERLGFGGEHVERRGVVIEVSGQYFGYGNKDLWHWMTGA